MRKYVAIIIMICLSASLLMGCGGSGGGDKSKEAQSKAEAQADEQPEKKLTSQSLSQTDGYLIFVKDANTEEPLAGVKVQFCSDTQCMMGRTDNTGVAVFNMEPGNYEAHILKQPEPTRQPSFCSSKRAKSSKPRIQQILQRTKPIIRATLTCLMTDTKRMTPSGLLT